MPYAKTSLRREKRVLRERMRARGCDYREIAAEFARVFRLRPRAAWRDAYGWSLQDTAERINDFRIAVGLDSNGLSGMTAPHLSEYESWPGHGAEPSGRKPSPRLLAVLAHIYRCDVADLVDASDREHLPKADLLIIDTYVRVPGGGATVADTAGFPYWAWRLAELRRSCAWSPADLACELKKVREGLPSVRSLAHMIQMDWESGKHRPGPRYRLLLAAVYNLDERDIFFETTGRVSVAVQDANSEAVAMPYAKTSPETRGEVAELMAREQPRNCTACGARLAQTNRDVICWPCQRMSHGASQSPPVVPPEFWRSDEMRAGFAGRHMGRIIKAYRTHRFHGLLPVSQEVMARWLSLSQTQVSRIEKGRRPVGDLDRLTHWAKVLMIPPDLLWFDMPAESPVQPVAELGFARENEDIPENGRETPSEAFHLTVPAVPVMIEEDQEEVERRRLLQSLAALGVQVSPLNQALDTVRTVLGATVGYDERRQLDHWEESVVEYGYSYRALPPGDLIPDLATDLLSVRSAIRRIPAESADYRSWCRVGGALSGLMAKSLSNLGHSRDSREWWNMALHLSGVSGDLDLGLWVRSQRIIHGLYENRPFPVVLRQIGSATEFSRDHPCAGLADLSAVRAQAAILSGDYRAAEDDLNRTEEILGRLPSAITNDNTSAMSWGEAEFRYTQAWVYSHMGDEGKTDRAVERSLSLYTESDSRSPVQVQLLQALARVQCGDINEGIRHAHAAYEPLASRQSTNNMVDALARRVLDSVPAEAYARPDVAAYRLLVISPSHKEIEQ